MEREKQRRIASESGKAAHEWTVEEAREAGRRGGLASHRHDDVAPQLREQTTPLS
jgi:general stress protein YciG